MSPFMFPMKFIKLQLEFAQKVTSITEDPITDVILKYTGIYLLLGLDFDFNTEAPKWKKYVSNFKIDTKYTYDFYVRAKQTPSRVNEKYKEKKFGCFSYSVQHEKKRIWIHFSNRDKSGCGPFSSKRLNVRRNELREMFNHIKTNEADGQYVKGTTWLFAHSNHNKLFPLEFTQNAKEEKGGELRYMSSWGQFINSKNKLREDLVESFRDCIMKKETIEEMIMCFPYRVMSSEIPIEVFYRFFLHICPPNPIISPS